MGIVKRDGFLPERSVVVLLYGQPGCGKTSAAVTAENPLLIDTDRGADRAVSRCDTLFADKWQDISACSAEMKGYKTVIIDTAKAMLDDYLAQYAIDTDYKMKANSLKRYGRMGEDFKQFVSFLRSNGSDIIFICHDKEKEEGDVTRHSPDCTGQSKELLLRIADQVGYVSKVNGKRTVSFEPQDNFVGKNVAGLPLTEIPDATSKEYPTFMAGIIRSVKDRIRAHGDEQGRVQEALRQLREILASVPDGGAEGWETPVNAVIEGMRELPKVAQLPFFKEMKETLAARGYTYDAASKRFKAEGEV